MTVLGHFRYERVKRMRVGEKINHRPPKYMIIRVREDHSGKYNAKSKVDGVSMSRRGLVSSLESFLLKSFGLAKVSNIYHIRFMKFYCTLV